LEERLTQNASSNLLFNKLENRDNNGGFVLKPLSFKVVGCLYRSKIVNFAFRVYCIHECTIEGKERERGLQGKVRKKGREKGGGGKNSSKKRMKYRVEEEALNRNKRGRSACVRGGELNEGRGRKASWTSRAF
jgi:hypothetical protein